MLNRISETVAYTNHLLPQLDIVNLQNCIHDAEYPNEHNIRYAEIYALSHAINMMIEFNEELFQTIYF